MSINLKNIARDVVGQTHYFEVNTYFDISNMRQGGAAPSPEYYVVSAESETRAEQKLRQYLSINFGMTSDHNYTYDKTKYVPNAPYVSIK